MAGRLEGKAVVITGAAQGLGEAYAHAVAAEGAAVVVNDIEAGLADAVVANLQAAGARAVAHNGDVSDWDFAGGLIERCVAEFGRIDSLVNNAGVLIIDPIEEMNGDRFRRLVEVNLLGQANCGMHALPLMMKQKSGAVINITSGAMAGSTFRSAYSAACAGVAGLTYAWAYECAGTGVRVNALAPVAATKQITDTEPSMQKLASAGRVPAAFAQLRDSMKGVTTEMNAPLVVFLLSDASAGVNGQCLRFTGSKLHLMARPAARSPVIDDAVWTVEKLAAVFAGQWKDTQLPLGLAEFEMNYVGPA